MLGIWTHRYLKRHRFSEKGEGIQVVKMIQGGRPIVARKKGPIGSEMGGPISLHSIIVNTAVKRNDRKEMDRK